MQAWFPEVTGVDTVRLNSWRLTQRKELPPGEGRLLALLLTHGDTLGTDFASLTLSVLVYKEVLFLPATTSVNFGNQIFPLSKWNTIELIN